MDSFRRSDADGDPRMSGEYVRRVPVGSGTLTLVGVVHDHPASAYRVRRVIEDCTPETLALELPPVAVPLFEQYARSDREPPVFGGEMSAAIQATEATTTVGIDRPTGGFVTRLVRRLLRERPSLRTVRGILSTAAEATGHALVCRLAAGVVARTGIRVEVDTPVAHDVDRSDSPAVQARDERAQVRRARAFTSAFRTPAASRLTDEVRENLMVTRLADHSDGDVVAVVGIDHLDPLADRFEAAG